MAKLDFFTIHAEAEDDFIHTNIELNFVCPDHITIIECNYVDEAVNLEARLTDLKRLYLKEIECTYGIKQTFGDYSHIINIYDLTASDPVCTFSCDEIKITEKIG